MSGPKGHALTEAGLVILTGLAHLVFETFLEAKIPFIIGAGLLWLGYLVWRLKTVPGLSREWGLRWDTARPAGLACLAVGLPVLIAMTIYGFVVENLPPPPTFWVILALYPIWGFLQQFLLNALLARNLRTLMPSAIVVPLSAVLFSVAHWPDYGLMALTLAAALIWIPIYLWRPNLWILGVCHGILGAVAYYGVLGRDAWALSFGAG
jgi:hypothetical protein